MVQFNLRRPTRRSEIRLFLHGGLILFGIVWVIRVLNFSREIATISPTSDLSSVNSISSKKQQKSPGAASGSKDTDNSNSFHGGNRRIRVHHETFNGADVLWASPNGNEDNDGDAKPQHADVPISGLLLVAHGCGHSNTDWFAKSPECPDCIGLPEEKAIVEQALDMGMVVLALSSSNRVTKCWSTKVDATPVALVLHEFRHRFALSSSDNKKKTKTKTPPLPLYAFGASSGGHFVSTLSRPLEARFGFHLDGFISQIAANLPLEDEDEVFDMCRVYVTMNKDTRTDRMAKARVQKCLAGQEHAIKNNNSTTSGNGDRINACQQIRLPPLPIGPLYFKDRIPEVSFTESREMADALKQGGLLDPSSGMVAEDPRQSPWRLALHSAAAQKSSSLRFSQRGDGLVADQSPISEVLNVAWGFHELARDGVKEALDFCFTQHQAARTPG